MQGLFAALPTPVRPDGRSDHEAFDRLLDFAMAAGVDGVCVGGATGEYPHSETEDRMALIRRAARLSRGRPLLAGIGAVSIRRVLELGTAAMDAGSRALLLPMPMFFRYEQQDLQAYCAHISRTLRAPCLLYDLPDFTNGLASETVLTLLRDEEFIVGIKDSSGRVENLQSFAAAREGCTLLVGDDRLLLEGLQAEWDGGISGVAACCPEVLCALYARFRDGNITEASRLQARLDDMCRQLAAFPTPWGIRLALTAIGFDTGPLPLPLSERRQAQAREFQRWFRAWRTNP